MDKRRAMLFLIVVAIAVLTLLYILYKPATNILPSGGTLTSAGAGSIAGFRVLEEEDGEKDVDTIAGRLASIREVFVEDRSACSEGGVSSINNSGVVYIYLCRVYRLLINASTPGNASFSSARNVSFVGIIVNETGNYTVLNNVSSNYRRVWAGVHNLSLRIPSYAGQGLVPMDSGYYSIANVPYIFFSINYLRGLGNASLIIRVTFSINGRNLSPPYIIEYYANSNDQQFISPLEYPMPRSSLEADRDKLRPLLDIDAGREVNLTFYVEVYVKASGDFTLELEIGYPGVRIIGGG